MPIPYHQPMSERVVGEVVAIEQLPIGASASRRAVVKWSDGDVGEALRWFDDEILFSEGRLARQDRGAASEPPRGTAVTCSPRKFRHPFGNAKLRAEIA